MGHLSVPGAVRMSRRPPQPPPQMQQLPGRCSAHTLRPRPSASRSHPPAGRGEPPVASMSQERRLSPSSPFRKHWQPLAGPRGTAAGTFSQIRSAVRKRCSGERQGKSSDPPWCSLGAGLQAEKLSPWASGMMDLLKITFLALFLPH